MGRTTHPSMLSPNMPLRSKFNEKDLDVALGQLREKALYRMKQKGSYNLASDFETIGTLFQEFNEFNDAVHAKLSTEVKCEELLDIAFSAILGVLFHKATCDNGHGCH